MTEGYDYIVVGAGTAGCVVAARLSQAGAASVLLLEAGSGERTRAMTVPGEWPALLGTAADWASLAADPTAIGTAAIARGRALGGSSAINAMAHLRGHRAVYDGWAAGGADGWSFADLLPCFRRSESAAGRDPVLRGQDGPVRVSQAERRPASRRGGLHRGARRGRLPGFRRSQRHRPGRRGLARPGHRRRRAGQRGRRLHPARARAAQPDRADRLPGHGPADRPRPVHRRQLRPRRRAGRGRRRGGDRVRRRHRLTAAADAVGRRAGRRPAAPGHRAGC